MGWDRVCMCVFALRSLCMNCVIDHLSLLHYYLINWIRYEEGELESGFEITCCGLFSGYDSYDVQGMYVCEGLRCFISCYDIHVGSSLWIEVGRGFLVRIGVYCVSLLHYFS